MPVIKPGFRLRPGTRGSSGFAPASSIADRLSDLPAISNNPGKLRGRFFVPAGLRGPAPLVVVLHGCTQDAAVYDHGSGWSQLAEREGFALLFPEQDRANNPMLCFNWFSDADTARGKGEAASIRAMIDAMGEVQSIDPARIFVTGLSAGGAMAAAMLAAYPELFAAGAIIAGVPTGAAGSAQEAFEAMAGRRPPAPLRQASHKGPWPRVQIWQGMGDSTVVPANADALARQWAQVQGLAATPDRQERVGAATRLAWTGADGAVAVEQYRIPAMGHGVPIDPRGDGLGRAGAHMLDVGLGSTRGIAEFFGIAGEAVAAPVEERGAAPALALEPVAASRARAEPEPAPADASGVQAVIERALRSAGLMR
jgi:poly(hydroxyalkanoate) depolymerase family esterase